jgi:aconitate hydratase A / 2-methylisocitrate dehydratase
MGTLTVGGTSYTIHRIGELAGTEPRRLPYTLRVLLENVLRAGDEAGARAVAGWDPHAEPAHEIAFHPSRVLLQDFTGVPAVVDLAAMRDAIAALGGDPTRINPLIPAELVIDHSVQVDLFASHLAFARNVELEVERNRERYTFLRWGQ